MPQLKTTIGRPTNRFKINEKPLRVDEYIKTLSENDFQRTRIRQGTKGWIMGDIHLMQMWVWFSNGTEAKPRKRTLMIRKGLKKGRPNRILSNQHSNK